MHRRSIPLAVALCALALGCHHDVEMIPLVERTIYVTDRFYDVQALSKDRAIIVGLHPGTVDTALSRPFQGNVAPGQLFTPDRAALQLLDVIEGLGVKESGKVFDWQGSEIAP